MSVFDYFDILIQITYVGGAFLIYNLELFGEKLKKIRKTLKLNQMEITELTGIDDRTIRRIENGKVLPKLDTLELLSPVYKEDIIALLLEYRFDDYSVFYEIKNKIENKLDNREYHTLHNEFEGLNILLSSTKNPYYKNLINQLILFTDAAILYRNNDHHMALNKLTESIKITTPNFNLDEYGSFIYSSMEIRVLMNIAFSLNKLSDKEKYLEIMEFCIDATNTNDELYPKLCHNLASAYNRLKYFQKALDFSDRGIQSCQENRFFNGLSILYYGKGVGEYRLNKEEYMESLQTSICLCKAFGQEQLKNTIISNCKRFLGIDL